MKKKQLFAYLFAASLTVNTMAGCSAGASGTPTAQETAQTAETTQAQTAAETTAAATAAQKDTASGVYKPGSYTGMSPNGRGGELKAEVTFSDSAITDIKITSHSETPGLSDPAITGIPEAVLTYQSLGVDVVSGATVTSNAILEAVADAVAQAGGDAAALKAVKVEKETSQSHEDIDATIVVVGGGAAGISAAVSAAYEGVTDIVLLEKEATLGGNALRSGGFIENLAPSEDIALKANDGYKKQIEEMLTQGPLDEMEASVWDDLKSDYDAYLASGSEYLFDCPALLAIEYYRVEGTPPQANMGYPALVNTFDQWFEEEIGGKFAPMCGIVGYTWPRWTYVEGYERGYGYFDNFQKYIDRNDLDITILTDTAATELVTDADGAVTGVLAEDKDSSTYTINASQAVLLCTGGFAANGEMLVKYNTMWGNMTADVKHDNSPGNTGDGIVMAEKIGAQLDGMDNIMMFPLGDFVDTGDVTAVGIFNGSSNLFINTHGERFVDETLSRFDICRAVFEQDDHYYYAITDGINSGMSEVDEADIQRSMEHGALYRGDTLEELAANLGIDPQVLTATVEQYNQACTTFEDEKFGRTTFADGSAILEAPFYATPLQPVAHITIGGIVTDDTGHVLNQDGQIIDGLYAAGETVAGSCGISAFAYGKEVARLIAEEMK